MVTPVADAIGGFNPLHCGAVVASDLSEARVNVAQRVSIPFIAGQWSLLGKRFPPWLRTAAFQSPSLRGSGRFIAN